MQQNPTLPTLATGYDNKGNPRKSMMERAFSLPLTGRKSKLPDRIAMLGIPEKELTDAVILAISTLFEKIDDEVLEKKKLEEQLQELESLIDVDVLAPIPNRRAFMRRLTWVISMLERYNHPSSIVYFDLNGFKEINDTYGHAAGDMAIRHVAELLQNSKRDSDFLARLGGDEFAIIMYYADSLAAKKRAKDIAAKIAGTPFTFNGQPLSLTCAAGFHGIRKGETAEQALHAADQSMFEDKRSHSKDNASMDA